MPVTNDFLPFATGAGANVITPATWATATPRQQGFQSGTAPSNAFNTVWRQTSSITAAIAQFISDTLAQNVVDNGNIATLEAQFISAIQLSVGSPAQAALWHFGLDTGPVNVMQVAATPTITAYAPGLTVVTFPQFSNTTTNPTLSANGLAAAVIVHSDGTALNIGDIATNTAIVFLYDATAAKWRIISASAIPQASQNHYGADVGTKNAMLVSTVSPAIATVTTGMQFLIKKGAAANDGPVTLNVVGTSGALTWGDGTAFSGGEWPANADGLVGYDGNFKLISVTTPYAFLIPGTKPPLQASRNYFVDSINGNDSNNGLTAGAGNAFQSWQHALTVAQSFNLNGFNITIKGATGTYAPFSCPAVNGAGTIFLIGDNTTPSNVLISATTGEAINVTASQYVISGMKVTTAGNGVAPHLGIGIRVGSALVSFYNMDFGSCVFSHVSAEGGATIDQLGLNFGVASTFINISGAAPVHLSCGPNSVIYIGGIALTITGTPAFTAFVNCASNSTVTQTYSSITGTATGPKFQVSLNGVINTNGSGTSYFPGSSFPSFPYPTGGQYN
jgi:hypothetical protein